MKKLFRWRSLSISSRLLVVLVGGLCISQLASGIMYLHERTSMADRLAVREESGKAADLIALLDQLDHQGRDEAQKVLNAGLNTGTHTSQGSSALKVAQDDYRNAVKKLLQQRLPAHPEIQVLVPDAERKVDLLLADRFDPDSTRSATTFDILATLKGGEPLVIRVFGPSFFPPSMGYVSLFILTLIGTLCLGTYILTRTISRRLRRLAVAAEAVGRGLQPAAIPESGPPELRMAARAFNRMQDRLRRYLGSRNRVLTAMSHDLRTPITRLRLRVASVTDPALQSKMTGDLEQMAAMVQEALDSLQGQETSESNQPVRIGSLLQALQSEYEELGFPLDIHNEIVDSVPAKPQALRRALTNLIDNAKQFATAAHIEARRIGDDCVFLVADNGPGIPPTELDRVLEPFYRVEASRNRETGGAGLGLSIARDIAHVHGGELSLANRPEGGLIAKLTLQIGG